MEVKVIAHTILTSDAYELMRMEPERSWGDAEPDIDRLAEIAGRNCYQAWGRPNPATSSNTGYLKNILDHEHFSVLEHGSVTFYVESVSRGLTHELVRHRHLSFSQLSQRYVNHTTAQFVDPPILADDPDVADLLRRMRSHQDVSAALYSDVADVLMAKGYSRKAARGAARSVLPEGTETKIVVTGNLRAWREFVLKRNTPHADAEIREMARRVLAALRQYAPHSVQDLPDVPEESA